MPVSALATACPYMVGQQYLECHGMTAFYNPRPQAYSPLAGGSLTGKYQDGGNSTSRFNLFPGASYVPLCLLMNAAPSPARKLCVWKLPFTLRQLLVFGAQDIWSGSTRHGWKMYLAWLAAPAQ
jgi:hypothetical protein